ncbi:asparagine synthetase B family protein [Streptomyces sp. WZ-12]|uniref:asparagine synthetase B family protein n=1 Tax=Streptomyces sp. WZ-12 TaxID=3030210 RepID=UPI0023814B39|nr:asparagine synthase C-terminal domain-containing protein [Streptomyces sp. WZ-12]
MAAEEIRHGVRRAVRDRLRGDVEIGACLSGGFDSSTLVLEAAAAVEQPLRTYSVVFGDALLDEHRFQREVADAVGSEHHEISCLQEDIAAEFEQMVRRCCYPQRETYNVAALMLSRAVRLSGLKGVLSGEGADELFFGYDSYAFDGLGHTRRESRAENERAWGRADFSWEVDWRQVDRRRSDGLAPESLEALAGQEFWRDRLIPFSDAEAAALTPMQLRSVVDTSVQLGSHLLGDHGDAMLMANSVEGRYPFLGNPVVDLALRVGDDEKVADFEGKACLKSAYAGIVPETVLRRAKQGFTAHGLSALADDHLMTEWRDLVAASGVFRKDALERIAAHGAEGKWDTRLSLISISMVIDELGLKM